MTDPMEAVLDEWKSTLLLADLRLVGGSAMRANLLNLMQRAAAVRVATTTEAGEDALEKAVGLLKTLGLDITYTDEGLRVVAAQIMRLGAGVATKPTPLTLAELEALPVGSVVLDQDSLAWQRDAHGWLMAGSLLRWSSKELLDFVPQRLLFRPEEQS